MRYHLILNRSIDLDKVGREAAEGKCPRHVMGMLRDKLGAKVHAPSSGSVTLFDKIRAKLFGGAQVWAMARSLRDEFAEGDVVFCNGEDTGIPIAVACSARKPRPKVAIFAHNLDRPRAKLALKLYRIASRINLILTNNVIQVDLLRRFLGLPDSKVRLIRDQTDRKFFTPGPPTSGKPRPLIVSVGLEQRDYRTLAEASHDLDVDVRISGFSSDAALQARAFPETLPANMSQKFYDWTDLVQLYRDADIVVVSLLECKYSAGITTVLEALSCGRPLIVSQTSGIARFLDPQAMRIVPPGDVAALRREIVRLLDDPDESKAMADRGYALGMHYDSDLFAEEIASCLAAL